jgi:hypothetical protein
MEEPPQCGILVQDTFGPQVSGCYENFDFTLLFEESILYLPPLFVALSLSLFRLWQLRAARILLRRAGLLCAFKLVSPCDAQTETVLLIDGAQRPLCSYSGLYLYSSVSST